MDEFFNEYSIPLFSITGLLAICLCIEKTYYCCKRRQNVVIRHTNKVPVHTIRGDGDNEINPLQAVCVDNRHSINSEKVKQAVKVLTANKKVHTKNNIIKNNLYKVYFPPTSARKLNKL